MSLAKNAVKVPVPTSIPGARIIIYSNRYVYMVTKATWDNETQNSTDDRKAIGKLCDDDDSMMWANKYYIKEYSVRYPAQHILLHNNSITVGVFVCALRAAEKFGILKALKEAFPIQWMKIFAASVFWIDFETSTSQRFEDWFFDNYCGISTAMDSSAFTRFYQDIQTNGYQIDTYRKTFISEYNLRFPSTSEEKRAYGCDGCNFNTTDTDNELAGYGHAKEDSSIPIVNVMSYVDEETGVSVLWDYFPGPILDKTAILHSMNKAVEFGFTNIHLMMDRGFLTVAMAKLFNDLKETTGNVFSSMVPGTYKFVEDAISKYQHILPKSIENYLPQMHIYGMKLSEDFIIHYAPDFVENGKPIIEMFLFYDDVRASKDRVALLDKISALESDLKDRKEYTENLVKGAGKYFTIHKCENGLIDGREFTIKRNLEVIQQESDRLGFFMIASNAKEPADVEITIARKRDCNEKAHRRRKTFFELTTPGTGTDESFTGKSFVADVAQNIQEAMQYYGNPFIQLKSSETFSTMVGELHKIKANVSEEGDFQLSFPFTKEQKQIGACFGLTEEDVKAYVRRLKWGEPFQVVYNATELKIIDKAYAKANREIERAKDKADTVEKKAKAIAEETIETQIKKLDEKNRKKASM